MSLVNAYREQLRKHVGLAEVDPAAPTPAPAPEASADASMGGGGNDFGSIDENTINAMLEILKKEIANRSGTIDKTPAPGEDPQVAQVKAPEACNEAELLADDVFFEMLNSFKANISNCENTTKKDLYRKGYNALYKMRDKFIKEMTACDEEVPPSVPALK